MKKQTSKKPVPEQILDRTNLVGKIAKKTQADVETILQLVTDTPESDQPSPIEELKDLLEAVLLSQRHLLLTVETLDQKVEAIGSAMRLRSAHFVGSKQPN